MVEDRSLRSEIELRHKESVIFGRGYPSYVAGEGLLDLAAEHVAYAVALKRMEGQVELQSQSISPKLVRQRHITKYPWGSF